MLFKFKNSRTKTKAKLLTLGALLFSFGVATSAVATSAWYNLLDIAVVSNLNLKIDMKDAWLKLDLKKNGQIIENDGNGYTKEQLGIEGALLEDVSGMYQDSWLNNGFDFQNDVPRFHSRYRLGLSKTETFYEPEENINKTYVQNEFILSAGMDTDVYLDPDTYIKPNLEANQAKADEKGWDANRVSKLNEAVHAVRISFLTDEGYHIVKLGEREDTYYGGVLDLNKDGYYDNDGEKEYMYGEYSGTPSYLPASSADPSQVELDNAKDNHNVFVACHQKGIEQVNVPSMNIKKENAKKIDSMTFDVNDPLKATTPICHVQAGETKRIVVSIYVEGWDRDMTDDIDQATFNVNIAFTGLVK